MSENPEPHFPAVPPEMVPAPRTPSAEPEPEASEEQWDDDEPIAPGRVGAPALVHLALFVVTVLSVMHSQEAPLWSGKFSFPKMVQAGWPFAASLMPILLAHEFGHYFMARYHGVPASLPYFLPMPLSPLGTWGAIIQMPGRIASRKALFDIGAAGPLAGMAVAIPMLLFGLSLSPVKEVGPVGLQEGQSLFYLAAKYVMLGSIPKGQDVILHPVAFAGWAGLFVTMINLVPYGQLDGGHIAYALLGPKHDRMGNWVRWGLLGFFLANLLYNLFPRVVKSPSWDTFGDVFANGIFWLVWFGMLSLMRKLTGKKHPPTDENQDLGPVRSALAIACMVLFVLLFMPAPLTYRTGAP